MREGHPPSLLREGRQVYVEGRLQTREWDDKDGNKRHTTEVVASSVQFLSGGTAQTPTDAPETNFDQSFHDDDIPF